MSDSDALKRALKRERQARKAAESFLEEKSLELYETNEQLAATAAQLQFEAKQAKSILKTAAEGIVTFDRDGVIQSFNPAAEKIFLASSDFQIGKQITSLLAPSASLDGPSEKNGWWTLESNRRPRIVIGQRYNDGSFEMELAGSRVEVDQHVTYTWIIRDITERRELERQLNIAQKLESVGQLAAGMAHEINTPIQFVGDNLIFLGESFEQVGQLHSLYERLVENCGNTKVASELCHQIRQYGEEIDIEFLREELGVAIQQSSDGIKRVADIVKAMKEISHPGSQKKTAIDVNSAIETTITVSRNEWKYVAVVETDLAPQLPLAAGYPGDLNQAILNILVNAAHAIEEKNAGNDQRGLIQCTTALVDRFIEIRISDSGCGMPLDVQKRIFDPFFTTKDVGKGTGQGLSIVYSVIVEKHGGEIRVESIPDEGTTFILRVPMVETSNNVAVNENANTLCR